MRRSSPVESSSKRSSLRARLADRRTRFRSTAQSLFVAVGLLSAVPAVALKDMQLAQTDVAALVTAPVPAAVEALLDQKDTIAVPAIPAVHRVAGWQTLGTQHLLLNVDPERTYLLTLHRDCQPLNWAQRVNVSRSDAAIWAGFDYIAADGARCAIGEIHRVSSAGSAPDS